MKITNIHRNCMGTASFDGKFGSMRKFADFIVYPMHSGDLCKQVKIQSDTRIGWIDLKSGGIRLTPPQQGGAYNTDLGKAFLVDHLSREELFLFKARIQDSASSMAGTNGYVFTDNSAAVNVFQEAA